MGSWWAGILFFYQAADVVREGYDKVRSLLKVITAYESTILFLQHKGTPFKVARLYRWMVVVSGPQFVEDVRKASDEELSFMEASNEVSNSLFLPRWVLSEGDPQDLKLEYTVGHDTYHNTYHVPILRSQLTRNLGILYPDIRDEIVTAFDEILDLRCNGEPGSVVIGVGR
jgi:hypothetical protein